jgi:glycosyltransferase involved in cell wall biosynthesis
MSNLITIGMPVYNGMPYLPESVQSLLNQTHRDISIVVIDDGSTDDSLGYLRTIRDSRVQVISRPHFGLTRTLNYMLEMATTPWLLRHDADDVAYPERVRHTIDFIHRYPNAAMLYSDADYYANGKRVGRFRTTKGSSNTLREITEAGYLLAVCHPSVALNVAKTRAAGGYRFDLHIEDIDLWWRIALSHDIVFIPEVTVGVRQNHSSTSWHNLETQALNVLYVQYLLLSRLSDLRPRSYDEVQPVLETLLDRRALSLKKHLRNMNCHLNDQRYWSAVLSGLRAFGISPGGLIRRLHYNISPQPSVWNGGNPALLARECRRRWSDHASYGINIPDLVLVSR